MFNQARQKRDNEKNIVPRQIVAHTKRSLQVYMLILAKQKPGKRKIIIPSQKLHIHIITPRVYVDSS